MENIFQTINPLNNNVIEKFFFLSKKEIHQKLIKSNIAFKKWKNISWNERIQYIKKLNFFLEKKLNDITYLITLEMGKPIAQSKLEIYKSINLCKYYCQLKKNILFKFLYEESLKNQYRKTFIQFEPIGTILGIMPWNYPVWQLIRSSIPNLLLGNVILIKTALNTSRTSLFLEEIFIESGFPQGTFQILLIKTKDIESVISNEIVQGITFTGSTKTGSIVGSLSGKYVKKSILELGGNDSFIVLKDIKNIQNIAQLATESRLNNTGQTCISAKRFIVDASIIDNFIDLVIEEMKKFREGDLYDDLTKIGYIARYDLSNKLDQQYKNIIFHGGKICLETKRKNNFFSPSLLKLDKENIIKNQEEIFGPIGIIIPFYKEKDIPLIVNNTIYGLGSSIWTSDIEKAEKISQKINTGMIFINEIVKSDPRLPFGGIKKSGYGRELSIYSINELSNWKTIVINSYS